MFPKSPTFGQSERYYMSGTPLGDSALDLLFRDARTYYSWDSTPVTTADLHALYDLVKMGPTSANASPARFVFVTSDAARAKLAATALPRISR